MSIWEATPDPPEHNPRPLEFADYEPEAPIPDNSNNGASEEPEPPEDPVCTPQPPEPIIECTSLVPDRMDLLDFDYPPYDVYKNFSYHAQKEAINEELRARRDRAISVKWRIEFVKVMDELDTGGIPRLRHIKNYYRPRYIQEKRSGLWAYLTGNAVDPERK